MQVAMAVAVVAGTGGHEAGAAVCFPYAGGVPGATGSGPPNWWSSSTMTGTETHTWREDPRWRGAFADAKSGLESFRVVVENTGGVQYLVMYWEVKSDGSGAGDKLYFGVWDDDSSTGNIFRLTRNAAAETSEAGVALDAGGASVADGAQIWGGAVSSGAVTWTAAAAGSALPPWMTDYTRADVDCATPPSTLCNTWAIRIRAKIDPAANAAAATPTGLKIRATTPRNFRFWYEIQDNTSVGVTKYSFPKSLDPADETGPSFPDPSGWQQAQLGTGTTCDGDILFSPADVYVGSTVGSTLLDLTSNRFHATPLNNDPGSPAAGINSSKLSARFRIANWGSAGFSSPEWKETCKWNGSGTNVTYMTRFDLGCDWTVPDPCAYQPVDAGCGPTAGTKNRHQCVLVDLGMANTGSSDQYTFSAQSVFRNMDFDVNSTLVREATIDIKGWGDMPDGSANRDVYLYVHTRNMPEKIAEKPLGDQSRQRFKDLRLPATGAIGTQDSARIQAAVQAGTLTFDQVEEIMPTYIVYVWHDTGRKLKTPAGDRKLLEAQAPFGLFLAHDGAIEGWKHELTVAGATLVGPNFYKVSPPNDSTFPVTITIKPLEPGGWWRLILILLGLLLFILVLYFLFRKRPPPPPPGP
jgi:hypothetical protein